jgi:hypothetical protein
MGCLPSPCTADICFPVLLYPDHGRFATVKIEKPQFLRGRPEGRRALFWRSFSGFFAYFADALRILF